MKLRWVVGWLVLALLGLGLGGVVGYWHWRDRWEHSQDAPILAAARKYQVEPALVKAVVWQESRFHPDRRGRVGELGLMQIREGAAGEWCRAERITGFRKERLYDPAVNTLAGTWYLGKLLKRYSQTDDPLPYALADYNAGRANVLRWEHGPAMTNSALFLAQITYPGTRAYVESVMARAAHYRPIFPPPAVKTSRGAVPGRAAAAAINLVDGTGYAILLPCISVPVPPAVWPPDSSPGSR